MHLSSLASPSKTQAPYGSSTSMDPPLLVGPYAEPNQASAWKGTRRRAACVSTFMGRTSPRHMSDPDKNRPLCAE